MSNQMDEIIIEDYNPQWPTLFEQEAKAIKKTLNNQNVISIEHFGSTAIPGEKGKPQNPGSKYQKC